MNWNAEASSNSNLYPLTERNAAVTVMAVRLLPSRERMVLREALPERGGFLDQVCEVTGLRARQRRFERGAIADSEDTAKSCDQPAVGGNDFFDSGVVGH